MRSRALEVETQHQKSTLASLERQLSDREGALRSVAAELTQMRDARGAAELDLRQAQTLLQSARETEVRTLIL